LSESRKEWPLRNTEIALPHQGSERSRNKKNFTAGEFLRLCGGW